MATYKVLYTQQLTKKAKTFQDGFVHAVQVHGQYLLLPGVNGSHLSLTAGSVAARGCSEACLQSLRNSQMNAVHKL
eukprot:scaffold297782_cov15-Tisochrysis_lutea.AAC.2